MMQRADLMLRLIVYLITRIGSDINPKQIMLWQRRGAERRGQGYPVCF